MHIHVGSSRANRESDGEDGDRGRVSPSCLYPTVQSTPYHHFADKRKGMWLAQVLASHM